MSIIEPIIAEHVTPHMQKTIAIIRDPLRQSFEESYRLFEEHVTKEEPKLADEAGKDKAFRQLNWIPWSYEMWRATDKFDSTYEALWDLRIIFSDIYPWSLIWKARDEIRSTMDNAIYTYEKRLEEQGVSVENSGKVRPSVMEDFVHDGRLTTRNLCEHIVKLIIMPPFNALVRPACKAVLEPIANLVPEPMKDFIDVNKLFDEVLDDVIHHSIVAALGHEGGSGSSSSSSSKGKEPEAAVETEPVAVAVAVAVE